MCDKDDEQETRLRDQFALAAIKIMLEEHKPYATIIKSLQEVEEQGETQEQYLDRIDSKVERIAQFAYKIADAMRKARLASFK